MTGLPGRFVRPVRDPETESRDPGIGVPIRALTDISEVPECCTLEDSVKEGSGQAGCG